MNNVAEFLRSLNVNESEYALIKKQLKYLKEMKAKLKMSLGEKRDVFYRVLSVFKEYGTGILRFMRWV